MAEPPSPPYTSWVMDATADTTLMPAGLLTYGSSYGHPDDQIYGTYFPSDDSIVASMHQMGTGSYFVLQFRPPLGSPLTAGATYPATSTGISETSGFMDVDGQIPGNYNCGDISGFVHIGEFFYDPAVGNPIKKLAISFSINCDTDYQVITGEVRVNSTVGYGTTLRSAEQLSFGEQPVENFGGPDQVVTYTAQGPSDTVFGTASIVDGNAFAISNDTCSGATVSHGNNCTISVRPKATALGAQAARLKLPVNTQAAAFYTGLSLTGIDPKRLQITPTGLGFGGVPAGFDSAPQVVTVTANGTSSVEMGEVTIGGTTPAAFGITGNTCADATLAVGQSCTITVVAHPTSLTGQTALLSIASDNFTSPASVTLHVHGLDPKQLQVSPAALDFEVVDTGGSALRTATLTAPGPLPVDIGAVTIGGANAGTFGINSDTCSGVTLAVGQSCTVLVKAQPTLIGWQTAELRIANNSTTSPYVVPLYVTGGKAYAGTYVPVTPARILDTRFGNGRPGTSPVGPGGTVQLQVGSRGGIPAAGVSAVVMNVTVTAPTAASFITVYPSGVARPLASNLNTAPGWTGANSVTVAMGAGGQVDLYNNAGSTHLIADVVGYYMADNTLGFTGGELQTVYPERIFDSRTDWNERLPAGGEWAFAVSYGKQGYPGFYNSHIRALAVNITAVDAVGPGHLTTWASGTPQPTASTLNYTPGAVVPNFAIIPTKPCPSWCGSLQGLPAISIYASVDVHVIVDIIGFYDDGQLADGTHDGLRFTPQTPARFVDSRVGQGMSGPLGAEGSATISPPNLLPATEALALNITAVTPSTATFVSVWPNGITRPLISTLNPAAGQTIPNAAIVTLGTGGKFNVFNNAGTVQLVIDQVGSFYYRPALAGINSLNFKRADAGIPSIPRYPRQAVATSSTPPMLHP